MKIGKVKKGKYEYYRIQVSDSFGKRKELLAKTRKEVKQKYEEYLKNDLSNLRLTNMTVEQFFQYYLFEIVLPSNSIKDKTLSQYDACYRIHIKNSIIGKIKINNLSKEHLQKYFNEKQKENLKISSIKSIKTFISTVLNYAENEDIIKKNYAKNIKLKKEIVKKEVKLLSDAEISLLLDALKENTQLLIVVKIALATGMRINEILALTESDFDFSNLSINVNKTLSICREYKDENTFEKTLKVTPPKTSNSIRTVYFPNALKFELKDFIKSVKQLYLKNAIKYNKNKPLFINSKFKFINYANLTIILNPFYKKCGIQKTGFHVLRHTHISKLYQAGVNQKIIQEQVGHNNISMTMHYTHIEKEQQSVAIQVLNNYFVQNE